MFKAFWHWHLCRLRFAEEWRFHRDRLADELKASGLSPREVRRTVLSRLGRRSRWRHEALKAIGGDWPALVNLIDWKRIASAAWLPPASLALSLVLLFVCNPLRDHLLASFVGESDEQVPIGKLLIVPAGFARFTWGAILLFHIAWRAKSRTSWRLLSYHLLVSFLLAAFGISCWVTVLQIWIAIKWPTDMLQGLCMLGFLFAYVWGSLLIAIWWLRDVGRRCPVCLSKTRVPIECGVSYNVLLNPFEIQSICLRGHGVLTESHWTREFQVNSGFWEDLAKR